MLLAGIFCMFVAGAAVGCLELARASAQVALARRVLQAGLLAGARARAEGEAPCPALGQALRRNLPPVDRPDFTCTTGVATLTARVGWTYHFAFLPLPPAQLAVQQQWPAPAPQQAETKHK